MTFATNLIDTLLTLATQQVQTLQALKDSLQDEAAAPAAPAAPTPKVYEVVDADGTNNLKQGARVVGKQTRTADGQLEMEVFDWLDTDGSTEDSTGRRLGWYRATRFAEVDDAPAKQATYPKNLVVVDAGNKRLISNGQTVVALAERTEDGAIEYRIASVYGKELGWYLASRFKAA